MTSQPLPIFSLRFSPLVVHRRSHSLAHHPQQNPVFCCFWKPATSMPHAISASASPTVPQRHLQSRTSPAPAYLSAIPKQHLQPCCLSPSHRPTVPSGLAPRSKLLNENPSTSDTFGNKYKQYKQLRTIANIYKFYVKFCLFQMWNLAWQKLAANASAKRMVSADCRCLCCLNLFKDSAPDLHTDQGKEKCKFHGGEGHAGTRKMLDE